MLKAFTCSRFRVLQAIQRQSTAASVHRGLQRFAIEDLAAIADRGAGGQRQEIHRRTRAASLAITARQMPSEVVRSHAERGENIHQSK